MRTVFVGRCGERGRKFVGRFVGKFVGKFVGRFVGKSVGRCGQYL